MQINLIAIGQKMPGWVTQGYQEYAKRLPDAYQLILHEIPAQHRGKNANIKQTLSKEADLMLAAIPKGSLVIALDRLGKSISTAHLAKSLQQWHDLSQNISILIGGPEGIDPLCLHKIQTKWSLSALTLPHPLVRVVLAEQIYRAYSIINRHPYHR